MTDTYKGPKKYLSYSQMRLWLEDKAKYRDRYYRGIEDRGSKELFFGSEVAKGLEDKTIVVPGLELYPEPEHSIKADVDWVPFNAYIDQYWPERHKFRETKTGRMKRDGSARWTQKAVDEHMQLDVYSLMIQVKHGWVDEECHLDWLHTRPKTDCMEWNGHQVCQEGRGMELTGEVTTFRRVITQTERDRVRGLILSVAREISEDYRRFLTYVPPIDLAAVKISPLADQSDLLREAEPPRPCLACRLPSHHGTCSA